MCLAVPGLIIEIDEKTPLMRCASVRFGEVEREINLAFVPEAQAGDYVLAHAGIAISIIDETAAQESLKRLDSLEEPA